jgi:hypothetical protein
VGLCGIEKHEDQRIDGVGDRRNRGLGRAFVQALRGRRLHQIYAAARTIEGAARDALSAASRVRNGPARLRPFISSMYQPLSRLTHQPICTSPATAMKAWRPASKRWSAIFSHRDG